MNLSVDHQKFLFVSQAAVPAAFNFVINGLIAWLIFRGAATTSLWGEGGFGGDLLITAFLLPLLTCLIVSPLIGKQVRNGAIEKLHLSHIGPRGLNGKPLLLRGMLLGVLGVVFAGVPIVWLLDLVQAQGVVVLLGSTDYAIYKAVWAALLALVVTPVIAWWALQSASRQD